MVRIFRLRQDCIKLRLKCLSVINFERIKARLELGEELFQMEEEEERIRYEEEEVTTIHRKTIRTQSTTRRKKQSDAKNRSEKTEIKLSPFIHGAKNKDPYSSSTPDSSKRSDPVHKLVQDTLNEYKGYELPQKTSNRIFLGAFDSDDDDDVNSIEDISVETNKAQVSKLHVWSFKKTGRVVLLFFFFSFL